MAAILNRLGQLGVVSFIRIIIIIISIGLMVAS
jgi:hypothetical protein